MINLQDLIKSGIMTPEDLRDLESEIEVKKEKENLRQLGTRYWAGIQRILVILTHMSMAKGKWLKRDIKRISKNSLFRPRKIQPSKSF